MHKCTVCQRQTVSNCVIMIVACIDSIYIIKKCSLNRTITPLMSLIEQDSPSCISDHLFSLPWETMGANYKNPNKGLE